MSLTQEQINDALKNITGSNPNLFVSTHACAPDFLPEYFEKYYSVKSIKDIEDTYSAIVPDNTIVFTFTPNDMYGISTKEDEQLFMKKLSDHTWVTKRRWEHAQNAKLYLPGDRLYNQLVNFETEAPYYDVFTLDGKIYKPVNKSFRTFGYPSKFLVDEAEQEFPDRRRSERTNTKSWKSAKAKDPMKFKSIPLQKLIDKLASPANLTNTRRTTEKNRIRILYIFACNPTTNVDKDLDSHASKQMPLSRIIKTIEDLRKLYSDEGHARFAHYFGGSRIKLRRHHSEEVTPDSEDDEIRYRLRESLYLGKSNKDKLATERSRMLERNIEKYGKTESGGSCFTPCKKSFCSTVVCSKWGMCENEYKKQERCLQPESEKAGRKKISNSKSKKKKHLAKKKKTAKKGNASNKKKTAKKGHAYNKKKPGNNKQTEKRR
jgi:hypothetical protein